MIRSSIAPILFASLLVPVLLAGPLEAQFPRTEANLPDDLAALDDHDLVITLNPEWSSGWIWRIRLDRRSPRIVRVNPERWDVVEVPYETARQWAETYLTRQLEKPCLAGLASHAPSYNVTLVPRRVGDRSVRFIEGFQLVFDRWRGLEETAAHALFTELETRFERIPADSPLTDVGRSEILSALRRAVTWPEGPEKGYALIWDSYLEVRLAAQLAVHHELAEAIPELERIGVPQEYLTWLRIRTSDDIATSLREHWRELPRPHVYNFLCLRDDSLPASLGREILRTIMADRGHWFASPYIEHWLTLGLTPDCVGFLREQLSLEEDAIERAAIYRALLLSDWRAEEWEEFSRAIEVHDWDVGSRALVPVARTLADCSERHPEVRQRARALFENRLLPYEYPSQYASTGALLPIAARFARASDIPALSQRAERDRDPRAALSMVRVDGDAAVRTALEILKADPPIDSASILWYARIALLRNDRSALPLLDALESACARQEIEVGTAVLPQVRELLETENLDQRLARLRTLLDSTWWFSDWHSLIADRLVEQGASEEQVAWLRDSRPWLPAEGSGFMPAPDLWR